MFDDKRKIIYLVLIFVILLLSYFLTQSKSSPTKQTKLSENMDLQNLEESQASKLFPMGVPGEFGDDPSVLDSEVLLNYSEFSDKLKTGEINFIWEVWKLRRHCPEDYKPDQCNDIILSHIDKSYAPPDNELLKKIFKDYFRYESALRDFEVPDSLKFEERYSLLIKKRREIFKEENSQLVFGLEESTVEFLNAQKEFLNSSQKVIGEERVKSYDSLKKKIYGTYYENVTKREDPYDNYQMELSLRESELSKMSPQEKNSILLKTQEKYFGKEGVERLKKAQEEIALIEKKQQDYEKKAEEFLSQNSSLPPKEKEEKLNDLRKKILGEEEASAYTRRKELEEISNSIK
jgi:hypothetical protein